MGTQLRPIRGIQMESWVTSCWVTSLKGWVLSFTSPACGRFSLRGGSSDQALSGGAYD